MFTGLIEETGKIKNVKRTPKSLELNIECKKVLEESKLGDSIAVNGICLTVTSMTNNSFTCDVMHETLKRTGIDSISANTVVNLERALLANGRLDGHLVTGHIDTVGKITKIQRIGISDVYTILFDSKYTNLIVEKGSIAIDGISLTVVDVINNSFQVSIIPHTSTNTTLDKKRVSDQVNLEFDVMAKYVTKQNNEGNLSLDKLKESGF